MNTKLIAAAAAVIFLTSTTAEARRHHWRHAVAAPHHNIDADIRNQVRRAHRTDAHANRARRLARESRHRRYAVVASLGTPAVEQPYGRLNAGQQGGGTGLVTVPTAAGINITCSEGFAGPAAELIADAVQHGIKFKRITCFSYASSHVRGSNHRDGNAFDSHPSIPANLVRAHGLRSGCDFLVGRAGHRHSDCPHVDNARNVGGVEFWNDVKHRGRKVKLARVSAIESAEGTIEFSARSSLVASINAKLARWVHPTGKCTGSSSELLATYYWQGQRLACGGQFNPHGLTAASRTLPCGTKLTVTNPHNGRSVAVTVNDRGPYTNAKLDLSLGAANALGLKQSSYVCVSL